MSDPRPDEVEVLRHLVEWLDAPDPRPVVLATVTETSASAPRPAGTQMAVGPDGEVVGSLSGGCIEADVVARAEDVAETGEPHLQDYGYSDADAWTVGLTCGGTVRVLVERLEPREAELFRELAEHIRLGRSVALVTALDGPSRPARRLLTLGADPGQRDKRVQQMLREHRSGLVVVDGQRHLVCSYAAPERMIIFGSNAFAAALCRLAAHVGYRVTVCDARPLFTTRERFPEAHRIVVRRPHAYLAETDVDERTVLCAMTHDPKFDDPLVAQALATPAQFVGAMGSRKVADDRRRRLRARGVSETQLERLRSPIGLDLGALSPEETAVSVLAEIIAARSGGSARSLTETSGPVHARRGVR